MPLRLTVWLLLAWLTAGGFLLYAATWPPVSRTQEGRVLETAREMAERPVAEWGVPVLNGAVRLRKPPLAYWLSASSFRLFGVSDFTGRLPMTLIAWATLGLTFAVAKRLFDPRAAVFAAATLGASWLFLRSALLAETDGPTVAFLVLGVYAFLRAAGVRGTTDTAEPDAADASPLWPHVYAAAFAGAVLCKGPPAVYLILFAVALCAIRRDWRPAKRLFTGGAVVTLLLLAAPWFAYVAWHSTEEGQLGTDLLNSVEGGDHENSPLYYVPLLMQAMAPWSAVWATAGLLACGAIGQAWRKTAAPDAADESLAAPAFDAPSRVADNPAAGDAGASGVATLPYAVAARAVAPVRPTARARLAVVFAAEPGLMTLAVWGLAVLVPLCFWGNKQLQYLLPVMPPTMMLVGWALAGATRRVQSFTAAAVVAVGTGVVLVLAPVGIAAFMLHTRRAAHEPVTPADVTGIAVLIGLAVFAAVHGKRHGRTAGLSATMALAAGVLFFVLPWRASVTGTRGRDAAGFLAEKYPDARFVFRGSELPVMSWALRRAVPLLNEVDIESLAADPRAVVLEQQQDDEHPPVAPNGFRQHRMVKQRENVLHVFVPVPVPSPGTPGEG